MPYDYPERLTGDTRHDLAKLWETLWKLTDRLNLAEEAQRMKEEKDGVSKT